MEKTKKKKIGTFAFVLLGLGSMIGSGIFVLLGPGAAIAGNYLPFAFLLGGFLAFLVALIYAEFTSAMPVSGSSLELLFDVYGRGIFPFIISWLIVLGDVAYAAINALGFGYYANLLVPIPPLFIAVGLVVIFSFLNLRGIKKTVKTENLIAGILAGALIILIIFALLGDNVNLNPFRNFSFVGVTSILAATALVYTAFIGSEDIAAVAGRAKKPGKTLPRALILAVAFSTLLFFLVSLIGINFISPEKLGQSKTPLFLVAEKLGSFTKIVVIIGALLATLSSLITMILVASNELHRIAKQGFFGKFLVFLNEKNVPANALLCVALLTLFLILTNSAQFVAYLGNAVYLVGVILLSLAVIQLRKKRPYLERPFRVPFFPYLPLFVAGFCFIILLFVGKDALFAGLAWATVGFLLYLISWIERTRIKWLIIGGFLLALTAFFFGVYMFFIL